MNSRPARVGQSRAILAQGLDKAAMASIDAAFGPQRIRGVEQPFHEARPQFIQSVQVVSGLIRQSMATKELTSASVDS
jgi:hypothetical protein